MKAFILICWYLLIILAVTSLFSDAWWVLDLLGSFRFQLAVLLIIWSISLNLYRKYIPMIIGIVLGLLILHSVIDKYQYGNEYDTLPKESLKIASINLLSSNHDYNSVRHYIEQSDPDLLVLLEYTPQWDLNLSRDFLDVFPYQLEEIRTHNFGIALWSKHAFESHQVLNFTEWDFPMIEAKIALVNGYLTVASIHLENPVGRDNMKLRNHQVDQLISRYQDYENFILIGDYNMTPYSHDYTRLRDELQLKETRCSISPTFPVYFMPLRLPIDHCLVSQSIEHNCLKLGPDIGSDHFPIEIVLFLHSQIKQKGVK